MTRDKEPIDQFIKCMFNNKQDFITVSCYGLIRTPLNIFKTASYTLAHMALARQISLVDNTVLKPYGILWDLSKLYCGFTTNKLMNPDYQNSFESLVELYNLEKLPASHLWPIFSFDNQDHEKYLKEASELIGLENVHNRYFLEMVKEILNLNER